MTGSQGQHYAVKFRNNPQGARILINEQVVGALATLIDCPCPRVDVVEVEDSLAQRILLNGNPASSGLAHGSRWLDNIRPVGSLPDAVARDVNVARYARLMVLFTLVFNTDPQYVSRRTRPAFSRAWTLATP